MGNTSDIPANSVIQINFFPFKKAPLFVWNFESFLDEIWIVDVKERPKKGVDHSKLLSGRFNKEIY